MWKKRASKPWTAWISWNGRHDGAPLRLLTTLPFLVTYAWCLASVVLHSFGLGDVAIQWPLAVGYVACWSVVLVYAMVIYDLDFVFVGFGPSVAVLSTCRVFGATSRGVRAALWLIWVLCFVAIGAVTFHDSHNLFRVLVIIVPIQWSATLLSRRTLPPLVANSLTAELWDWLGRDAD